MNTKDIIKEITPIAMHVDCSESSAVAEAAIYYRGALMVAYRSNPATLYWFDWDMGEIMGALSRNLDSVGRFVAEVKRNTPAPMATPDYANLA